MQIPRLAYRKAKYWLKREWDYLRVNPVDALFFLTYRCTSRCKTCTMWQRGAKETEMGLDGWKKAVDMCYDMGVRWIEFFGGDALLRKDILVPLTEYAKQYPDLVCDLPTNCNLMDKNTAEGLVQAGMDNIWISIDGVALIHDEVRGKGGTFDKVNQGIDFILAAKGPNLSPTIHANCTISKHNVHSFEKILLFAENKGLDAVHLEYVGEYWQQTVEQALIDGVKPTPYFVRQKDETSLVNEREAYLIKEKIADMKQQAKDMKVSLFTRHIDRLTVKNMVKGSFDNRRCYITRFKVTIDPMGFVVGCPFYGEWKMGNIEEQSLKDIWNNQKHKRFIKAFKKEQSSFCQYCILGVQRNPTLFQDIRNDMNAFLGRVRI